MRNIFTLKRLLIIGLLFISANTFACDIKFSVDKSSKKDVYELGDIIVIKVEIVLIHRGCPTAIAQTKFDYSGLKVIGATDWKELSPGHFERKLKLKVIEIKTEELILSATRTCNIDGGFGSISLKAKAAE